MQEHFICPNTGAMVFPARPGEKADDQIQQITSAMLEIAMAVNEGRKVSTDTISLLQVLSGRT